MTGTERDAVIANLAHGRRRIAEHGFWYGATVFNAHGTLNDRTYNPDNREQRDVHHSFPPAGYTPGDARGRTWTLTLEELGATLRGWPKDRAWVNWSLGLWAMQRSTTTQDLLDLVDDTAKRLQTGDR